VLRNQGLLCVRFVVWRRRLLVTLLLHVGLRQGFGKRFLDGLVGSWSFLVIY